MLATQRTKRLFTIALAAITLAAAAVGSLLFLINRAPAYYHQIDALSAEDRKADSKQFVRRSAGIFNQIENGPVWGGRFDQKYVNAWLASDFVEKHGNILPRGVSDPRVSFEQGQLSLAFQKKLGPVSTIISVIGLLWMPEPNLIAMEFESVRAGVIPLPSAPVVETLSAAAKSARLDLEWKQHNGNPVALLRLKASNEPNGLGIQRLELQKGVLYVAGRSRHGDAAAHRAADSGESMTRGVTLKVQPPESSLNR